MRAEAPELLMNATDGVANAAEAAEARHQVAVRELPAKLQKLAAKWPSSQQRLAEYLRTRPHDRPPDSAFPTIFSYGGECAICQQRTQPLFAVVRACLPLSKSSFTVLLCCSRSPALQHIAAM